jgi:hypothetical protein
MMTRIFTNLTEEQVGFAIGYIAAFVVDKFVKVSAIRYIYKVIKYIAVRTKIPTPSPEVLFERAVDSILEAYESSE